jgi:hypothetical protein
LLDEFGFDAVALPAGNTVDARHGHVALGRDAT